MSDEELNKLMKESRRDGRKYIETFKTRCREIQEQIRKILAEKAAEEERKSEKKKKKTERGNTIKNYLLRAMAVGTSNKKSTR